MKSFFMLGRNPQISVAEVLSYLEARDVTVEGWELEKSALLIETKEKLDLVRMLKSLGGSIAAGEIWASGADEEVLTYIENNDICPWTETKFDYSLASFCPAPLMDEVTAEMKRAFKNLRVKAMNKPALGLVELQDGAQSGGSPKKMLTRDRVYFLFKGKQTSFGIIKAIFDVDDARKRDMGKPVRREALAISPRMARILINLAQIKEGQTVLDPFCGIGVILHEAMLQGMNATGIDVDTSAVEGAKTNDEWLKRTYSLHVTSKIILGDSKKTWVDKADGMASEPSLGEVLKEEVSQEKATRMILQFERLITAVLNNMRQSLKPGAKMVFTTPYILTKKGRVGCDVEVLLKDTGLKMHELKYGKEIKFPITESREGKIVARQIFVFEK